ncbi:TPA: hypothetical protein ACGPXY_001572 [Escherichia coli]
MPAPVKTTFAPLSASAMGVPMNEFLKLTRIPIVIYYGDFIAEKPDTAVGPDTDENLRRACAGATV